MEKYETLSVNELNLFLPHANNKGTDQPAHPRSLISAFVVHCLDSIIPLLSISEMSSLESHLDANPEDMFSHDGAQIIIKYPPYLFHDGFLAPFIQILLMKHLFLESLLVQKPDLFMSHVMRLWYFLSSVISFFKSA